MWKKIAAAGAAAAAVLGAGGVAMAASGGNPSTAPSTAAATTKGHADKALRRAVHGTFVTRGKGGTFVTHELARGTVAAVSAGSITVRSADGSSETFVVDSHTKVRTHPKGAAGAASSISAVKSGDTVEAVGKGTPATATLIVDVPAATS
jgi:hypothetical protein